MPQSLAHIALVVRDYDEAIAWFTTRLGFTLIADEHQPEQDKRWVLVAPPGAGDNAATLLLPSAAFQRCFASPEPWAAPPAPPRRSKRPSSATRRAGGSVLAITP